VKVRGLLVVILVLAILLPISSIFQSAYLPSVAFAGIGQNVVVVAKEDNVYARLLLTVQPLGNESNVTVVGGSFQPPTLVFPNGTSRQVNSTTTFSMTLPNRVVFLFGAVSASGPGFSLSPSSPISVQFLGNQNFTSFPGVSIPGVEVFPFTISGDAQITAQLLGVVV